MPSDLQRYESMREQLIENEIKNWVVDYRTISRERFDREMVFCLMTPQTKAKAAQAVLDEVQGDITKITPEIMGKNGVRFKNIKMSNIQTFMNLSSHYETFISDVPNRAVRALLYGSVHGFGLKEASHLCRNTGRGHDIAIVDRHILNCFAARFENKWEGYERLAPAYQYAKGIFNKEIPLTEYRYHLIEDCIVAYSNQLNIPHKYLDMIWWSEQSGHLFK